MITHVAFLRAINIGRRRIKSDALRELFEELGFSKVGTYLASGNVVFDSDASSAELERLIADHLGDALGYTVDTFVRQMDRLREISETTPFELPDGERIKRYVVFLHRVLGDEQRKQLASKCSGVDELVPLDREIHWLRYLDAGESIATGKLERALGVVATRRTTTTLEHIVKKFGQ